jgi:predicted DNA-binding ribbon-helix-helix protein
MGSIRFQRTQVLLEPEQHDKLEEIARREHRSLSDVVREMLDAQLAERRRRDMAFAAQALLSDYVSDKDLTAFTALDAEEVR